MRLTYLMPHKTGGKLTMITYKPLSELPIREVSELWNHSFEGYMVNASMPLDRFIARIGNDGLCLERSLACYVDGIP
ncbi:hypothetical protein, partial [Streptomyces sp. URMC 124]|uniref:hypothetical protein n=1 Tax=Streptomyces sp. URMC 124 TaxID=3423405 RepID=UPI003F539BAD